MSFKIALSHVAILVPSVRKAAEYLQQFNFEIGAEEEWDGEGTREVYIEKNKVNSLLLMQPIKVGAYQRALEKRGPGLHHLAIDVLNLEDYIDSLSGSGWLLHPKSIQTIKQVKTAYLARPGFSGLIEVQQKEKLIDGAPFVEKLFLAGNSKLTSLLASVGLKKIVTFSLEKPALQLLGHKIEITKLLD